VPISSARQDPAGGWPTNAYGWVEDLGWIVTDRDVAEQLHRILGALAAIDDRHDFDKNGRCTVCRPSRRRRWRRRRACTVHAAFVSYHIAGTHGPETAR
jgi:hypothetical protein